MNLNKVKEEKSSSKINKTDVTVHKREDDIVEPNKIVKSDLDHHDLVKLTREAIDNLIESDPFLSGLPLNVTIEEIKAQIAVARGQAITLFLNRGELPKLSVVVPTHKTTVLDLKRAIKRHTNLCFKRENIKKKISWKHVWKKYHLSFDNVQLCNDNENLKTYGITNKAELYYVKKHREKNKYIR